MSVSAAQNAVYAKAHALYGKRLTGKQYEDLLRCQTVGDIAAFLKTRTDYADVLDSVTAQTVHRGQLELRLRQKVYERSAALARFEKVTGKHFHRYFEMRADIEQILSCLRLLSSPHHDEYLLTMPAYFSGHTQIDLWGLAAAATIADVTAAVKGTPYRAVLEPYAAQKTAELNLPAIERDMGTLLYNEINAILQKGFSRAQRQEIEQLLAVRLDMTAMVTLYRERLFLPGDTGPDKQGFPFRITRLRPHEIKALKEARTAEEVLTEIKKTVYGRQFPDLFTDMPYIEGAADRVEYRISLHTFRYSTNSTAVMLAYLFLAENELRNITHIIEGVRYTLPPDEIKTLLVMN